MAVVLVLIVREAVRPTEVVGSVLARRLGTLLVSAHYVLACNTLTSNKCREVSIHIDVRGHLVVLRTVGLAQHVSEALLFHFELESL